MTHTYRIIRHITSLRTAGYACTVMAIREDTDGKNEFATRLCSDWAEADRAAQALESEIRERIEARGGAVVNSEALASTH